MGSIVRAVLRVQVRDEAYSGRKCGQQGRERCELAVPVLSFGSGELFGHMTFHVAEKTAAMRLPIHHGSLLYRGAARYPWRLLDFAWDELHRQRWGQNRRSQRSYIGKCKGIGGLYFFDRNSGRTKKEKSPPAMPEGSFPVRRLECSGFRRLGRMVGRLGSGRLRLGFAAVELAHDIGANRPRRNLRGFGLLAFAIGLLVRRADERSLDEHVSLCGVLRYAKQAS